MSINSEFKQMYDQVLRMLPTKVLAKERGEIDYDRMVGFIRGIQELNCFVDREIEVNNTSQLVSQLCQVVIGCVHKILIQVDEIELSELNQSYVMYKFHRRLIKDVRPMISGEKEFDGSYDEDAVCYMRNNGLI